MALFIFLLIPLISLTAKDNKSIAILYPVLHPFFRETSAGARIEARNLGIEVIIDGPENSNVEDQLMILEKYISEGVDGIAISVSDPEILIPTINKAVQHDIKVLCFDSDAPGSQRLSYIGTQNTNAGVHIAQAVLTQIGERGSVLINLGSSNQANLQERYHAFTSYLEVYPEIQIKSVFGGHGDYEDTVLQLEKAIEESPEFDIFVGFDAASGPAAVSVWRTRGLKKDIIVFDDQKEVLEGIRDGIISSAIVQEQKLWGELIVRTLSKALDGESIPEFIYTDTNQITLKNYSYYYPEFR